MSFKFILINGTLLTLLHMYMDTFFPHDSFVKETALFVL